MRDGEPADGPEFFALLVADDPFCAELGRAVLAAGRLETALAQHIARHPDASYRRATLGQLIELAKRYRLLTSMLPVLEDLRDQRNYITHNLHGLLSGPLTETVLPSVGLLDSDVDLFTERARQLAENLNDLAAIVERDAPATPAE